MIRTFDGITFKDRTSKEFSLLAKDLGRRKRAEEVIYKNEVLESDKDFDEHSGKYKPYLRDMAFHILDQEKKDEIYAWLKGYGVLRTVIDKDGYFKASVVSSLDLEDDKGLEYFPVTFKINPPFLFLDSGLTPVTLTNGQKLINPGTHTAEPQIKIVGTGDINLTVNGKAFKITGLVSDLIIDSELQHSYNATSDLDGKVLGEYPILSLGENTISWSGNVTKVEITPNWRNL